MDCLQPRFSGNRRAKDTEEKNSSNPTTQAVITVNMEQLPPELLLHILSYLPIRNLHDVQALNSSFNTLIKENNNQVYRSAASLHQFVDKKVLERDPIHALKDISRHYFSTWMDDVEDWKSFCE